MIAPLTPERLAEVRAGAARGHRMSCSDPDDPTRQTPYSVQLDLLDAVERLTERAERAEGALARVEEAWRNRPLIVSGVLRDLEVNPSGRGGELHHVPSVEGWGKSGCPGDNLTAWVDELREAMEAKP